jgi:hypothetical protein
MMKTFTLAASMMVLAAISGQALAGTITSKARSDSQAYAKQQTMSAFDSMAPGATDSHRDHGGPKANDYYKIYAAEMGSRPFESPLTCG